MGPSVDTQGNCVIAAPAAEMSQTMLDRLNVLLERRAQTKAELANAAIGLEKEVIGLVEELESMKGIMTVPKGFFGLEVVREALLATEEREELDVEKEIMAECNSDEENGRLMGKNGTCPVDGQRKVEDSLTEHRDSGLVAPRGGKWIDIILGLF